MKDELGNRMKAFYEDRARVYLPRRNYIVIRCDGKAFHTYLRGCQKPFDLQFIDDMQQTTIALCKQVQNCILGYVQSDEISLVLCEQGIKSEAWFDNNVQKIASISASIATAHFNRAQNKPDKIAYFDSRCFSIPTKVEAMNYLFWRQMDAERNSIQMLAQAHFSHKELHKKNTSDLHDMLFLQKGINWAELEPQLKRGAIIRKVAKECTTVVKGKECIFTRNSWEVDKATPVLYKEKEYLENLMP